MANQQSGAAGFVPKPSGKLFLSISQNDLVSNIWTIVELNNKDPDFTDGIEDKVNHKITPGVPGFYAVMGQVMFLNVIATKQYEAAVLVNGSTVCIGNTQNSSVAGKLGIPLVGELYLSDTDYLQLQAKHLAGEDTVDIEPGKAYTFLSLQRVR